MKRWNAWRGFCYLPMVWTSKYSGLLSMLHILMAMACAYLLLGMFIHSRLGKESAPQDEKPTKVRLQLIHKPEIAHFLVYISQ